MHMKLKTIIVLSVVGILVPFIGIPLSWRVWLSALLALAVGMLAYQLLAGVGPEESKKADDYTGGSTYVDARPQSTTSVENTYEDTDEA